MSYRLRLHAGATGGGHQGHQEDVHPLFQQAELVLQLPQQDASILVALRALPCLLPFRTPERLGGLVVDAGLCSVRRRRPSGHLQLHVAEVNVEFVDHLGHGEPCSLDLEMLHAILGQTGPFPLCCCSPRSAPVMESRARSRPLTVSLSPHESPSSAGCAQSMRMWSILKSKASSPFRKVSELS